ncbi:MAG: hypothetical protein K2G70_05380, partial [Turicibacter sp.]|nr:hypothetical protein [Turicibacter sp.]
LFLYDQQIDLDTIKNIFAQISNLNLETRVLDYFKQHNIKQHTSHIKIVYRETIVKDLSICHYRKSNTYATNVISLSR